MDRTDSGAGGIRVALWIALAASAAVGACANGGDSGSGAATSGAEAVPAGAEPAPAPEAVASSPSQDAASRSAEPLDMELASRGEELFSRRGCVACHKIGGGRLVGPDLMGVTERRSFDWIYAMIMAPDSMLREDPVAKQLFAEYLTPMPNQRVQPEEGRALYEYLRARTEGVMESSGRAVPETGFAMDRHRHRPGAAMGAAGRGGLPAGRGPAPGHGPRARPVPVNPASPAVEPSGEQLSRAGPCRGGSCRRHQRHGTSF